MKKIDYNKLNSFIALDIIRPFYKIRLDRLESANLSSIFARKNPYLFKAKNIETAGDLAKAILDAFLSSQEETIFGDLMENLAIHICRQIFNGKKAEEGKYKSIDLIFERENKFYIVGIKSGPNWGNSDQVNIMRRNFKLAKKEIRVGADKKTIIAVNGCMYGRDNSPHKVSKDPALSYYKICGQKFWELISGDNELYKKIVQPLDKEAKKRDETFKDLYIKKINEMTEDIVELFYSKSNLDWDKIIEYVSKAKNV
ncbi:MAG: PmeII family type II restriction endonuclease [Candidatus Portnoybacteria bacterium]|nr:PmeII family type II restriction endonuclease [Candidatus Portnoybacteria bacterium]MDD4982411.1 PmeII family type II restriction endonuclease [Candidatus Portnoybacteria bacterium]